MSSKEVDQTATDFAKSVALARKAGYDGVEIMGSEGYLINQFLAARTNDRDDQWGGSRRAPHALPRRGRTPLARAGRRRLPDRLPDLAARPRRGRPDLGGGRRAGAARSRRPASPSSTPASAGTRRGCRRSSPRSRAAPGDRTPLGSRRSSTSRSARPTGSTPPSWPRRSSPPARPTSSRWRGRCSPTRPSSPRRWTSAPTRSTPASPATRPASTTSSATERASCLVNPRACHETELVLHADARAGRPSPSSAPVRPASPPRSSRPSAASR